MKGIRRAWKVYGMEGHRQRESFGTSDWFDWSTPDSVRKVSVLREDMTKTNEFAVIDITRNTSEECEDELFGQLYDGIFENSRKGSVEEINGDGLTIIDWLTDGGIIWAEQMSVWPYTTNLYTTNDDGVIADMYAAYDGDLSLDDWCKWISKDALTFAGLPESQAAAMLNW